VVRVWSAKSLLYEAMRVPKLLATLVAAASLMQLEVVRLVPQPEYQGVTDAVAVAARTTRANTERMLATMGCSLRCLG
jgi:hypothetical protein